MKKVVQLGQIAKIYSGGTPSRTTATYWGGNIPWVKTTQIQNCLITESDIDELITEEGFKNSSAKMVPKGTILMAMYGQGKTRGQVGVLGLNATINQACVAIELKSSAFQDFIYQQLQYKYKSIRKLSNSGSQENLSAGLIKEIDILLPPLPEQRAIADILSTWDKAIENMKALIATKEKRLAAFGRELFDRTTIGKRDGWKVIKLKDVLKERGDKSTGMEEVFSVSVHKGLLNQVQHLGRSFSAAKTDHYNRVHFGDIVYTKSPTGDFPYGIVKQSRVSEDVIVSPLYGVYTPVNYKIGVIIAFYFESPTRARNYLYPIIQKGAKNTINITNSTFTSKELHLPIDKAEQRKIADFILTSKEEINLLKQLAKRIKEQKRGLMQKLVSGKWRVNHTKEIQ